MEPYLGRYAFTVGTIVVLLSAALLPFLGTDTPEFYASLLALLIGLAVVVLVAWDVRRQARREVGGPGGT